MKIFLQINVSKKKKSRESYFFNYYYSFNYFKDKSLKLKKNDSIFHLDIFKWRQIYVAKQRTKGEDIDKI